MGKRFLAIQLVLVATLSMAADYHVPDLQDANWQTVMFLTPSGIIGNHFDPAAIVIRSFYSDVSNGQVELGGARLALVALLYVGLLVNALVFARSYVRGPGRRSDSAPNRGSESGAAT